MTKLTPLWRVLQYIFYAIGGPLQWCGAWLVEAADICRERAEAHEPVETEGKTP